MKTRLASHNGPTMSISSGGGVLNVGGRLVRWTVGDDKGMKAEWEAMLAEYRAAKKSREKKSGDTAKSAKRRSEKFRPVAKNPSSAN